MLSVICPIYNEEKYIEKCIQSILEQDYPKEKLEILFVDGMSTDKTREIVKMYSKEYSFIRLLDNPHKIVPYAMNKGIEESNGDIIMRLDAHATYECNYFSVLVSSLQRLKADNIGSMCKTDVLNKTPKTLAIKEVLSNKFGVGNSTFRLGVDKEQKVDTVPFGCWPRRVFEKYGLYNVKLVRNQDIELNKRIINGGGSIYIVPNTFCTYLARETYSGVAKNNYGNGKWNILTVYYTKLLSSLSIRHFIPLVFLLSLVIPLLLSMFYLPIILVALFSFMSYVLLLGYISIKTAVKKRLSFVRLFITFIILHLSYGCGSLVGICSLPILFMHEK